ncbi:hypothetical protein [Dactylosporangium sp. NPDC049140]
MRDNTRRPCAAAILPSRRCVTLARPVAARGWDVLTIEPDRGPALLLQSS